MLKITNFYDPVQIYNFQMAFDTPYFYTTDFETWKKSYNEDVDGDGRTLFQKLMTKAAFQDGELVGFIQYGKTAFGFDKNGEPTDEISYPVIRNLYFAAICPEAGELLLQEAIQYFRKNERIYAFFHYFGMSCFARHGKLFETHRHIEKLLKSCGFTIEHQNVYYSTMLSNCKRPDVSLKVSEITQGDQQDMDFCIGNTLVGGCQVHYVNAAIAYLRWIYVCDNMTGKGIGTRCMTALKEHLCAKGIERLDTDTALDNLVAQHYYEKNRFTREGITRSYLREL